ncbi:hypothetical protein [Mycobacteroides abscessus]|uniref:hypothetical protein n=1 Tax=Mycobacteroides abscessus TaxID=36809 RepID=UPI0012FFD586|nr:hypothetical protein [Mycobacteroides abscessus]
MAGEITVSVSEGDDFKQGRTVIQFPTGGVAEVVAYVYEGELQVTVNSSKSHGVTVTVDDNDVFIRP